MYGGGPNDTPLDDAPPIINVTGVATPGDTPLRTHFNRSRNGSMNSRSPSVCVSPAAADMAPPMLARRTSLHRELHRVLSRPTSAASMRAHSPSAQPSHRRISRSVQQTNARSNHATHVTVYTPRSEGLHVAVPGADAPSSSSSDSEESITEEKSPSSMASGTTGLAAVWSRITRKPKGRSAVSLKESSCYVFGGENPFRVAIFNLIHTKVFEAVIILVIFFNCVMLAIKDPTTDDEEYQINIDYFFVAAFSLEMLLKVTALGFAQHQGAYLRNGWNILDFVIILLSFLGLVPGFGNYTALRTFRVLRPLRSLNAIPQLKTIVTALLHSIKGLVNVMLLSILVVTIFGIIGVQLWQGNFRNRCRDQFTGEIDPELYCTPSDVWEGITGRTCPEYYECVEYLNPWFGYVSFDNVGFAFLVVMQCITLEGWSQIMTISLDVSGWYTAAYFILVVLVCSYFILNLALAVISFEFTQSKVRAAEQARLEAEEDERELLQTEEGIQRVRDSLFFQGDQQHHIFANDNTPALRGFQVSEAEAHRMRALQRTIPGRLLYALEAARRSVDGSTSDEGIELDNQPPHNDDARSVASAVGSQGPRPDEDAGQPAVSRCVDSACMRACQVVFMRLRHLCFRVSEGDPQQCHTYELHLLRERAALDLEDIESMLTETDVSEPPSTLMSKFIIFCVVLNTAVMSTDYYGATPLHELISGTFNTIFTAIFGVELIIRLLALGVTGYCGDLSNSFDGFVTIISIVEIVFLSGSSFSVLRAFRLLRVFRLLKSFPSLRAILRVTVVAIKETGYLSVIFLLYLFIAALLGMQLFGGQIRKVEGDPPASFDTFYWSFYTVFEVVTRDSWPDIMRMAMRSVGTWTTVYFLVCVFAGDFIILNLFLAILISSFESVAEETDEANLKDFRQAVEGNKKHLGATMGALVPDAARRLLRVADHKLRVSLSKADAPDAVSKMETFGQLQEAMRSGILGEVCPLCGDVKVAPFPPPSKKIVPLTADELHARMCARISLRKAKAQVIRALLEEMGHGDALDSDELEMTAANVIMRADGFASFRFGDSVGGAAAATPTPELVDEIFGRAWEAGLLLNLNADDFFDIETWEPLAALLKEEQMVLNLRVGEEQIGQSLVAYTRANVPSEFYTNGGTSLFVFGPRNRLRVGVTQFVLHRYFDRFILVIILVSSILMAFDSPRSTDNGWIETVSNVFTGVFIFEAVLKVIALNFYFHPTAYLRDGWNKLDFLIVVVAILSWILQAFLSSSQLSALKVLRTLRAIRPLRVINRNRGLKMVVSTLILSIKGIANVALITSIIYLVFAILGVQLFAGSLYRCTDPTIKTRGACVGEFNESVRVPQISLLTATIDGRNITANRTVMVDRNVTSPRRWVNAHYHFDNTYEAFLCLFHVATLDDWGTTMFQVIDSTGVDTGPSPGSRPYFGIFFLVFIITGCFFLLNMFVGVIISSFTLVKEQLDGSSMLTSEQKLWVETQRLMLNFRPEPKLRVAWPNAFSKHCFAIAASPRFEIASGVLVALNVIFIGMEHYDQSDTFTLAMFGANVCFVAGFIIEATVKIGAHGKFYFRSSWNRFDFFLILVGIVDLSTGGVIKINLALLRILRVFRIMRMLALIKKAKDVRILLETMWYSMPSLANIGMFLLLVFFMYAVLGNQLFGLVKRTHGLTEDVNFESFGKSFLFVIQLATLDNWGVTMLGTMNTEDCGPDTNPNGWDDCGTPLAPLYYFTFVVVASWVIVNLFIAIILDNFNMTMQLDKSALKMAHLKKFADAWSEYDPDATLLMETKHFPQLLKILQPPLGVARVTDRKNIMLLADDYRIVEHGGVIHFVETMVPMARRVLGVRFAEAELRAHEDHWRTQFPSLSELKILRYKMRRVTVDQYFGATYLAAAFRRRTAYRFTNTLRDERRQEILAAYERAGIPPDQRSALHRMDRAAQRRGDNENFDLRPDDIDMRQAESEGEGSVTSDGGGESTPPSLNQAAGALIRRQSSRLRRSLSGTARDLSGGDLSNLLGLGRKHI